MHRVAKVALAAAVVVIIAVAGLGALGASRPPSAAAAATTLIPPAGSVYTGVSSGAVGTFASEVGKHPAVYGEFVTWGQSIHFAFDQAASSHALLMLHIGTGPLGHGVITPAQIAHGNGDAYLVTLSALIASRGQPVYIRLMAEMNNANNPYCAVNTDGSTRGADYAPAQFIAAWRRVVTVLRGGTVAAIDAKLAALGQPRLHGIAATASIAKSPIAFVWTPETAGTPNIPSNSAATYYPGDAYVDWVGTDFYSKFPNFAGLDSFYKEFRSKPFVFAEWAIWGGDNPAFVAQFFAWVNAHKRVAMIVYNQGFTTSGPFSLTADPQSTAAIRGKLAPARYLAFATG